MVPVKDKPLVTEHLKYLRIKGISRYITGKGPTMRFAIECTVVNGQNPIDKRIVEHFYGYSPLNYELAELDVRKRLLAYAAFLDNYESGRENVTT